MKRFVIDGNKVVLNKTSPEHKAEEAVFEENEVYAVDICYSTGEGKPKVVDEKETTVYKRALDKEYNLKMKVSLRPPRTAASRILHLHTSYSKCCMLYC